MELLNRMPKSQQQHWMRIYKDSVEAKQNCEAIAYRGHRLLDQVWGRWKEEGESIQGK